MKGGRKRRNCRLMTDSKKKGMKKMEKKPLNNAMKYFFGAGDFMYSLSVSFKTYYWTYFLTTVIALPLAAVGVMNTIINVFDFIMAFCWGAIIDSMKPGKHGRYRSILLIMAPLIVISHGFQWFAPTLYKFGFSATVAVVATCICFGIYIVFFNFAWCANVSLIGVCASSEADRARLSGNRNAYNKACSIFIAYIATFLLGMFNDQVIGYAAAATILGILTIPGYYLHVYLTKGYEKTRDELEKEQSSENKKANRITFKDIITVIKSNAQILWVLLTNSCTQLTIFVFSYMGVYLFTMSLGRADLYAFYLTVTNFATVVASLLSNILAKKIPVKRIVQVGLLLDIVAILCAWLTAKSGNALLFTASMVVVQFALGLLTPGVITFYSSCAVYSEWKTGINCTGTIMGLSGVPIKIALTAIGIIVPAVLASSGYVANEPITESVKTALINAYAMIPLGLYVAAFLIITFLYKLTQSKVDQCAKEIAERNRA